MKAKIFSYITKFVLELYFRFISVEIRMPLETQELLESQKPFILAGWHNQILSLTYHCSHYLVKIKKVKLSPLVSQSKDGELIYQTFLRFNLFAERGSSSKGGAAGLRALLKRIKQGWVPILTPDGPRGPLYSVQPGVIQLSSMTGLPIVHFFSAFDRHHAAKSWDEHKFPKFGSKQLIDYSTPFVVPKKLDEESLHTQMTSLQSMMMEQVRKVEASFGEA